MFRHLVVCRLFSPGSKLKTIDYLWRYLHVSVSRHKLYSFIDRLSPSEGCGIKSQVEQISYAQTLKVLKGEVGVVFYDMTTLYFEASDEDDLRMCGFSKEGRHRNPQIFLGLLVAIGGNPIGYEIFEGNIHESKTLIPMVESLAGRFGSTTRCHRRRGPALKKQHRLPGRGRIPIHIGRKAEERQYGGEGQDSLHEAQGRASPPFIRKDKRRVVVSMSDARAGNDAKNRSAGLRRLEKSWGQGG
jgi:Transposase